MTTTTKKQTNPLRHRSASPASDTENPTLEELLKKNAELERRLRKYKEKRKISQTVIKPLIRPRGEAGSRKRGFILYEAMEMSKVENGAVLYDRMRDCVRKACVKAGLDLGAHYRNQDHEKLGQVFHLVRKTYSYLTTERFPHNWAIADMVKGYLAGTRKEHHRQAREDEQERKGQTAHKIMKKGKKDSNIDTDDNDMPRPSSSLKTRKSKRRVDSDLEDNEEQHPNSGKKARKSKRQVECDPEDDMPQSSFSSKSGKSKTRADSGPEDNDIPRSSFSGKSGKLITRAESDPEDNDMPRSGFSSKSGSFSMKSRKSKRRAESEGEDSDNEEPHSGFNSKSGKSKRRRVDVEDEPEVEVPRRNNRRSSQRAEIIFENSNSDNDEGSGSTRDMDGRSYEEDEGEEEEEV